MIKQSLLILIMLMPGYYKGNSFMALKNYEEALNCYNNVLALNPSHNNAENNKEETLKHLPPSFSDEKNRSKRR